MNNKNTATVRTTVNTVALSVVALIASRLFGVTLDVTDPLLILGVAIATPIFYRASLWASAKWPTLGYVLFGKNSTPTYE